MIQHEKEQVESTFHSALFESTAKTHHRDTQSVQDMALRDLCGKKIIFWEWSRDTILHQCSQIAIALYNYIILLLVI